MFAIAPGASITEFDVTPAGQYLLRTAKGRFMVSRSTVDLIRALEGKASARDIAGSPAEARALERFVDEHVIPTGVFTCSDEPEEPEKGLGTPQSAYVYCVREIIKGDTLRHATEIFKHLYHPWVVALLLGSSLFAQIWFWVTHWGLRMEHITAENYVLGGALFLMTLPFHELGHGSACGYYGARHGSMGFAMYLVFPCFLTDVSEAWRLPRWSRVGVDLGGVYFHLITTGVFSLAALWTGRQALAAAIMMTNWCMVHSLKPYLRGDGYWVLMDVVGIPAPYQRAKEYLAYLFSRRRGDVPVLLRVSPLLRVFTLGYVFLTTLLATWIIAALAWKAVTVVLPAYPSVLAGFAALPFGSLPWWRNVLLAFGQTVLIVSLCIALWSRGRAIARRLQASAPSLTASAPREADDTGVSPGA